MPGVRDLRADLAAHVRRAEAGERIAITSGGRVVATLGPPPDEPASDADSPPAGGAVVAARRTDGRWASGRVNVWGTVRFDRLIREVRG